MMKITVSCMNRLVVDGDESDFSIKGSPRNWKIIAVRNTPTHKNGAELVMPHPTRDLNTSDGFNGMLRDFGREYAKLKQEVNTNA